jgi:protein transport protein SEC13
MAQNTSTMADNGQNVDLLSIEANEVQHDAVLDYYGRRLATCSSDKTIKIFEVEGEKHTLVETLRGYVTTNYHTNTLLTAEQT